MFCIKCGQFLTDGSAFCTNCGTTQPVMPAQPAYQQPAQPQYQQPAQPVYQQPVQPQYQQPAQPVYQQPVQPQYQQPAQPVYQQPVQPQYQQPAQPVYQQPTPAYVPKNLSWKDFYDRFVSKKVKSTVIWMVVICFFTALVSLVLLVALDGMMDPALLVADIAIYSLSGVLLLATKHWGTVLLPTIYGAIWTIVSMANDGTPTGFVAIIVGVTCISVLKKAAKAYQDYKTSGVVPEELI